MEKGSLKHEDVILRNQYSFEGQKTYVERYGMNLEAIQVNEDYVLGKEKLHLVEYRFIGHALEDLKTEQVVLIDFFVRTSNGILKSPKIETHTIALSQFAKKDPDDKIVEGLIIIDPNRNVFSAFLKIYIAISFHKMLA